VFYEIYLFYEFLIITFFFYNLHTNFFLIFVVKLLNTYALNPYDHFNSSFTFKNIGKVIEK